MKNTYRPLRVPEDLEARVLEQFKAATKTESYIKALEKAVGPVLQVEHTENTTGEWATKKWVEEQIEKHLNG